MHNKIISEMQSELLFLDFENRNNVIAKIGKILNRYEIKEITTELSTGIDNTMTMIYQYCAIRMAEGIKESTINIQKNQLIKFFCSANVSYEKIKPIHITIYVSDLMQKGMSANSVSNIYNSINAFYKWANRMELLQYNPMDKVKRIKNKKENKEAFTKCDLEKIKECCDKADLALIEFWCSTGCRVSETINIKIDDIDFNNKTVNVRVTKNGNPRMEYLSDVCIMRLKEYLDTRNDTCEYLFVSKRGSHKLNRRSVNKRLDKLSKLSGVENVHPHRFRRTFCTSILNNGMPIQEASKLMGHASINTTMIYADINDSKLKNSFEKYVN